ncbi:bifunctional glycerol-3-phosphate/glycerone-phosphate O-acyltransferase GPT2 SCDLUD_003166 [Saccharomycodes ludwigii]|uniref:bifunctional glycerol-3-phosphate/glycerone-phosphate O-acyltransferase GPT2 n=1 Tax=Saccharomycodes ludwigii TaxID=36035 RepID=UPI001E876448|nr:hypothetical protein SCDLUD_003166 [Saccharomycodes ludwigii]KAH3900195.1 hypothetical protein SCDLUD_003166 [Saccharomycodes ludwigii]
MSSVSSEKKQKESLPDSRPTPPLKKSEHIPKIDKSYLNDYNGYTFTIKTWLYDVAIFCFNILFAIFFREIFIRGEQYIPPKGVPTIIMCAPHANQFIDGGIVMSRVRNVSGRQTCFVIAASSFKRRFISLFSKMTGGIPVPRAQDYLKVVPNVKIVQVLNEDDPVAKFKIISDDSNEDFDCFKHFMVKGLLGISMKGNCQIKEIVDKSTLILAKQFKSPIMEPTSFKYAPKINNSKVFQNVFNHLDSKGCIGIFPEGGSHDRPSLLPVKAGVSIMALGASAADPTMKVHVVPCGLNYFHRDKFRSRAVLEFGKPIVVDHDNWGTKYVANPYDTVSELLKILETALYSVTVNAPDFDTLMVIQTARRLLFRNTTDDISLNVEINRRLMKGYTKYKDDERIIRLKEQVKEYNKELSQAGLKDYQIDIITELSAVQSLFKLVTRLAILFIMVALALPGSILFSPIFLTASIYSKKKALEGLKKSVVKIKGTDLLATWKLVVALAMAPILYITYSVLFIKFGPESMKPFGSCSVLNFIFAYIVLVFTTWVSFRTGERGMDVFKSLPPLLVCLVYPNWKLQHLKSFRDNLSKEMRTVCDTLGPTVFPNYEKMTTELEKHLEEHHRLRGRSRSSSINSSILSNPHSRSNSCVSSIHSEKSYKDDSLDDVLDVAHNEKFEVENMSVDDVNEGKSSGVSKISDIVRESRKRDKK